MFPATRPASQWLSPHADNATSHQHTPNTQKRDADLRTAKATTDTSDENTVCKENDGTALDATYRGPSITPRLNPRGPCAPLKPDFPHPATHQLHAGGRAGAIQSCHTAENVGPDTMAVDSPVESHACSQNRKRGPVCLCKSQPAQLHARTAAPS